MLTNFLIRLQLPEFAELPITGSAPRLKGQTMTLRPPHLLTHFLFALHHFHPVTHSVAGRKQVYT